MEKKESVALECYICLDPPAYPVATPCGHIFCWKCLQRWISGLSELQCPVCKNGLDMSRVISLYSSSPTNNNTGPDDRPKIERPTTPVRNENRPGFVI
jgi:E3 ubiquitin-protein ligase RNF5